MRRQIEIKLITPIIFLLGMLANTVVLAIGPPRARHLGMIGFLIAGLSVLLWISRLKNLNRDSEDEEDFE